MLITLIVLAVLNLVLSFVVFCGQRALWARLPEPAANTFTVGDVASAEAWIKQQQDLRKDPPTLTPEEQAQVAAYRSAWQGASIGGLPDLDVLALAKLNPA
jgi:hypothetical protein